MFPKIKKLFAIHHSLFTNIYLRIKPCMKYLCIAVAVFLLYSCKEKVKTRTIEEKQNEMEVGKLDASGVYSVEEIGWTVKLPQGWDVLTKEQLKQNTERGKEVMEESLKAEVDASGLQQLLNLRKNMLNSFLSTIEKFDPEGIGSWEENNKMIFEAVKQTFESNGVKATYSEDTALIDGLRFNVYKTNIYGPDEKEIIMYQSSYCRLINGYDVGINIIYNNEKDRKELEKMLFESMFSKRN